MYDDVSVKLRANNLTQAVRYQTEMDKVCAGSLVVIVIFFGERLDAFEDENFEDLCVKFDR